MMKQKKGRRGYSRRAANPRMVVLAMSLAAGLVGCAEAPEVAGHWPSAGEPSRQTIESALPQPPGVPVPSGDTGDADAPPDDDLSRAPGAPRGQAVRGGVGEAADAARQQLAGLEVKGKAPATGYAREEFGQRWSDDVDVEYGHNGCDTRNDILRRDLRDLEVRPGTDGCVAQYGILDEPYTGETTIFDRGTDQANRIHIDHVVPLANAWVTGAQYWDATTRRNFANDPRNLLAVDGSANQSKRDGDAATWQPPNKDFRCEYALRMIDVKAAYGLWVAPAERDALDRELGRC